MPPKTPLPYDSSFSSPEEYIDSLLEFVTISDPLRILCGGVHVLDFLTSDISLFQEALPAEWQPFLLSTDVMRLLDLLVREEPSEFKVADGEVQPPASLLEYIQQVRRLSLVRDFTPHENVPELEKQVTLGMKSKKIHEVANFADYVERLTEHMEEDGGTSISHYVDFGSGQNYLGRAMASEPYNKHIVAMEGREHNVVAAKEFDIRSELTVKPVVRRNKKLWTKISERVGPNGHKDPVAMEKAIREIAGDDAFDFRSLGQIVGKADEKQEAKRGKGIVQYISARLDSGDLSEVVEKIEENDDGNKNIMAVSIHSCGNLSHHGIRSLILNPDVKAVAIVGCCYNLLTEKLGPPTYKDLYLRPTLQALNGRVIRESARYDPQGFPMSERFSKYEGGGIRLNVTARMMACQAPGRWSRENCDEFFRRHFQRAVLQRIFLDRGVVSQVRFDTPKDGSATEGEETPSTPFNTSTNPVIIGSLKKACYSSLKNYVRGVVEKLSTSTEFKQYAEVMDEKMADITDEEIDEYEAKYMHARKEIAVIWTMMAFSAIVIESLIVTDRWLFLKEHQDIVKDAWVEAVFDFQQSPRNMVVVGVKK